ncbi:hypothetical protein [Burkholderia gladioli]|uniref:hypothetical protein n=1 Tax=Burkholderia gladioli TaxID=28095 RepID=UPI00163E3535|nr:hypothetical protein [Burkholderia gladioli]
MIDNRLPLRWLALIPTLVLSVANMPPFVQLWSATESNVIGVAAWLSLFLGFWLTAPFQRWMLDKDHGSFDCWIRSLRFAVSNAVCATFLLVCGTKYALLAMGLHGAAFYLGAVVCSFAVVLFLIIASGVLLFWTEARTNAAHRKAFPSRHHVSDEDDVDLSE